MLFCFVFAQLKRVVPQNRTLVSFIPVIIVIHVWYFQYNEASPVPPTEPQPAQDAAKQVSIHILHNKFGPVFVKKPSLRKKATIH